MAGRPQGGFRVAKVLKVLTQDCGKKTAGLYQFKALQATNKNTAPAAHWP